MNAKTLNKAKIPPRIMKTNATAGSAKWMLKMKWQENFTRFLSRR